MATSNGPPHVIQNSDSGIDIDIAREVLSELGYNVKVVYMSLARAKEKVKHGEVDAYTPTFHERDSKGYYVSKEIIKYRPTVFTLAKKNYKLSRIKDLESH
ncbi:transporter substrate-binding domain-containing protein, partial [Piscirickettsia litoralis]|uniref:transporter substrate-binding domain-containing protein n=1 Tax=Piscirickettsia litoralis TaxID=1891921 RepID=UPI0013018D14